MVTKLSMLGATVKDLTANIGWGSQASSLSVTLVEDLLAGDEFVIPTIGAPIYTALSGFTFNGICQSFTQSNGEDGLPIFRVTIVDPREILEGTQVILAGYRGTVSVPNVYNVFGYYEGVSFGSSLSNQSGMPWWKVREALEAMSVTETAYGGPLSFRGYTYAFDLSELPTPPSYYRIGAGSAMSIMDIVSQICLDGGCDYYVELVGFLIRVRTTSRATQPPLGTLSALATANQGTILSTSSCGMELRNETTSALLLGGEVSGLHLAAGYPAVRQFWGYDLEGNPILGEFDTRFWRPTAGSGVPEGEEPPPVRLSVTQPGPSGDWTYEPVTSSGVYESMLLNAAPVADILGSTTYGCTDLEMRFALQDYYAWSLFIESQRPDIAPLIVSPFQANKVVENTFQKIDGMKDDAGPMLAAIDNDMSTRMMRMYEFVRGYASEYLGKKWAVQLPFLLSYTDPDTLQVVYSVDVTDAGYLAEDEAGELGLDPINEEFFRAQDGRVGALCRWDTLAASDLSNVSPQDTLIETTPTSPTGDQLFSRISVDRQYIFTPAPAVVVTLPSPLMQFQGEHAGNSDEVMMATFQMEADNQRTKDILSGEGGYMGISIHPCYYAPNLMVIPTKSNILTYGPWYVAGAPGRTIVEQNPQLTPWDYGGWDFMDLAGSAQVNQAVTQMQVGESGQIELVALPAGSLGGTLSAGGPNITGINIDWNTQGVKTNYSFQTFTPRFGNFSKGNVERIRKLGLQSADLRRQARIARKERSIVNAIRREAHQGWLANAPKPIKKKSPHEIFVGRVQEGVSGSVRSSVLTSTYDEAYGLVRAASGEISEFRKSAAMGLDGLLRPFRAGFSDAPSGMEMLPYLAGPSVASSGGLTAAKLNPWGGYNDMQAYLWGEEWEGIRAYANRKNGEDARPLGLRGPLMVVGWGYGLGGNPIPSGFTSGTGVVPSGDFRLRADKWKAGPVDLLWAEHRGVWTCHGFVAGTMPSGVPAAGASGILNIGGGGGVAQVYAETPTEETKMAVYSADHNKWYKVGDTGGGGSSGGSWVAESNFLKTLSPASGTCFWYGKSLKFTTTHSSGCCWESDKNVYVYPIGFTPVASGVYKGYDVSDAFGLNVYAALSGNVQANHCPYPTAPGCTCEEIWQKVKFQMLLYTTPIDSVLPGEASCPHADLQNQWLELEYYEPECFYDGESTVMTPFGPMLHEYIIYHLGSGPNPYSLPTSSWVLFFRNSFTGHWTITVNYICPDEQFDCKGINVFTYYSQHQIGLPGYEEDICPTIPIVITVYPSE